MNKSTPDIDVALHQILCADPQKYVALMSDRINKDPNDSFAYSRRHDGWMHLGQRDNALADISRSIELRPHAVTYLDRGNLLAEIGRHREALDDYAKAEAMASDWDDMWGPLFQAHSHAWLGNEKEALAACRRLPDDHWTPGLSGAPGGNKQEVTDEIRRILAEVRGK